MASQVRIVLVNTSHPGNIGSVARAMKTMGLSSLYLVNPKHFPHDKALEMASGAGDVLEQAVIRDHFVEAIADCSLVIGASARLRAIPWPLLTPRDLAEKVWQEPSHGVTAVVFGQEQSGLTNKELQRCHFCMQIPANPAYSSLNISAAVQIVAYELLVRSLQVSSQTCSQNQHSATSCEIELFFNHLEMVLLEIEFLKPSAPRQLMTRLRRLFFRARPDVMEVNILRGMLTAVQRSRNKRG
jgi:tRNA (cytidine32/uridine32-2'-O)-methyltransferase